MTDWDRRPTSDAERARWRVWDGGLTVVTDDEVRQWVGSFATPGLAACSAWDHNVMVAAREKAAMGLAPREGSRGSPLTGAAGPTISNDTAAKCALRPTPVTVYDDEFGVSLDARDTRRSGTLSSSTHHPQNAAPVAAPPLDPCEHASSTGTDSAPDGPGQRVFMAVLRTQGCVDPEAVVRRDRLGATVTGAELVPAVRSMVALLGATMWDLVDVLGAYDGGEGE